VVRGDLQVLAGIADEMDVHPGLPDGEAARRELAALGAIGTGTWLAPDRRAPGSGGRGPAVPKAGEAVLATWHNLLDVGRMQDGEPHLAGTARAAVARMSAATAAEAGVGSGAKVSVATSYGEIRVPVEITAMPDRVVWLPTNSAGCSVRRDLGAGHGSLVTVFAPGDDPRTPAGRSAE
jgi:NADH-quinone oxidoreductase subunit G